MFGAMPVPLPRSLSLLGSKPCCTVPALSGPVDSVIASAASRGHMKSLIMLPRHRSRMQCVNHLQDRQPRPVLAARLHACSTYQSSLANDADDHNAKRASRQTGYLQPLFVCLIVFISKFFWHLSTSSPTRTRRLIDSEQRFNGDMSSAMADTNGLNATCIMYPRKGPLVCKDCKDAKYCSKGKSAPNTSSSVNLTPTLQSVRSSTGRTTRFSALHSQQANDPLPLTDELCSSQVAHYHLASDGCRSSCATMVTSPTKTSAVRLNSVP